MARPLDSYRLLQLVPADGWCAVYQEDEGVLIHAALAAWALLETRDDPPKGAFGHPAPWPSDGAGTDREMVGIDPEGEGWYGQLADEMTNFVQYVYCGARRDAPDHTAPRPPKETD
jgi:hypothetical protein